MSDVKDFVWPFQMKNWLNHRGYEYSATKGFWVHGLDLDKPDPNWPCIMEQNGWWSAFWIQDLTNITPPGSMYHPISHGSSPDEVFKNAVMAELDNAEKRIQILKDLQSRLRSIADEES